MGSAGTPTFPTEGGLTPPPTVTTASQQTNFENWLAATRMLLGAQTQTVTISSGSITPDSPNIKVDTEASAASDDLDFLVMTNYTEDGRLVILSAANDARTVVVRHNITGSGKFFLHGAANFSLDDDKKQLIVRKEGTVWVEVARSYGGDAAKQRTDLGLGSAAVLNASATPTASTVVVSNGSGQLENGWISKPNVDQHAGLVFLQQQTIVNAPAMLFNLIPATYEEYELWLAFTPVNTGDNAYMRVSYDAGATFKSSLGDYVYCAQGYDSSGGNNDYHQNSVAGFSGLFILTSPYTNRVPSNSERSLVKIHILYIGDASGGRFQMTWESAYISNGGLQINLRGSGSVNFTGQGNAIILGVATGLNQSTATARLYGYKKS